MLLEAITILTLSVAAGEEAGDERDYWLRAALGMELPLARAAEWFEDAGAPTLRVRLERGLHPALPGAALYLGGSLWNRGSSSDVDLSLLVLEADTGLILKWPADGLWRWIFPHARLGVTIDYLRVRAGELAADPVVPGVTGNLGLTLAFSRDRVARGARARLFAWGEAGYAWRLPARIRLGAGKGTEEEPSLSGPAVRLGDLDLSGWSWSAGLGVRF